MITYIAVSYVFAVYFAWKIRGSVKVDSLRAAAGAVIVLVPLFIIGRGFDSLTTLLTRGPTHHSRSVLPLLKDQELVMLMTPMVEGEIFAHTFTHDLEVMGPWSPNVTVSLILRIEDLTERRLALREYFEPLKKRILEEQPGLVLFSPFRKSLGGLTMHDIFVRGYRLFPIAGYRLWKRTPNGWIIYERIARPDRRGL